MKKTTKIETHIEMQEIWVISKGHSATRKFCSQCLPSQIVMMTPDEAAIIAGVSLRILFRLIEAEQVHYLEKASGALLICPNSLLRNRKLSNFQRNGKNP